MHIASFSCRSIVRRCLTPRFLTASNRGFASTYGTKALDTPHLGRKSRLLTGGAEECVLFSTLGRLSGYSTNSDTDALDKLCVDYEEYKRLLANKDALLVDVREPTELVDDGRIPGTVNIPLDDVGPAFELPPEKFTQKYGRKKPQFHDPNIVFSCRRGVRATTAMQTAHSKGYKNARFYRGSFCEWEEKGEEIIKS